MKKIKDLKENSLRRLAKEWMLVLAPKRNLIDCQLGWYWLALEPPVNLFLSA